MADAVRYGACPTCGCEAANEVRACPVCGDPREIEGDALYSLERTQGRIAEELDTFIAELLPVYAARGLSLADALSMHQMRRLALRVDALIDNLETLHFTDTDEDDE